MNKLVRISATVASSLALVAGFSGIAGAASIDNSGRNATNSIEYKHIVKTHVHNDTMLHLSNSTGQQSWSGDAKVTDNNNVRHVTTGDASNTNTTSASVTVDNSSSSSAAMDAGGAGADMSTPSASIDNSGRDANNSIESVDVQKTTVKNDTNVCLNNQTEQTAASGDAKVTDNNNVGSVTTGSASNTNSSTFTLNVTN